MKSLVFSLLCEMCFHSYLIALEPLVDSSPSLMEQHAQSIINKFDSDKDGKLQEKEAPKNWKKYARFAVDEFDMKVTGGEL